MLRSLSSVFIVCLTLSLLADGKGYNAARNKEAESHDMKDVTSYILTQLWPPSACMAMNQQDKRSNDSSCSICKLPPLNSWLVHGLWPDSPNGPVVDCETKKFSSDLIDTQLKNLMNQKWINMRVNGSNEEFWSHEYNKHGRCALSHPQMQNMTSYFSRALELVDQYNMEKVLTNTNFTPGHDYDYINVEDGMKNNLKKTFRTKCFRPRGSKEQYLLEVNICLDKSFQVIDCPTNRPGNCQTGKVTYPAKRAYCN